MIFLFFYLCCFFLWLFHITDSMGAESSSRRSKVETTVSSGRASTHGSHGGRKRHRKKENKKRRQRNYNKKLPVELFANVVTGSQGVVDTDVLLLKNYFPDGIPRLEKEFTESKHWCDDWTQTQKTVQLLDQDGKRFEVTYDMTIIPKGKLMYRAAPHFIDDDDAAGRTFENFNVGVGFFGSLKTAVMYAHAGQKKYSGRQVDSTKKILVFMTSQPLLLFSLNSRRNAELTTQDYEDTEDDMIPKVTDHFVMPIFDTQGCEGIMGDIISDKTLLGKYDTYTKRTSSYVIDSWAVDAFTKYAPSIEGWSHNQRAPKEKSLLASEICVFNVEKSKIVRLPMDIRVKKDRCYWFWKKVEVGPVHLPLRTITVPFPDKYIVQSIASRFNGARKLFFLYTRMYDWAMIVLDGNYRVWKRMISQNQTYHGVDLLKLQPEQFFDISNPFDETSRYSVFRMADMLFVNNPQNNNLVYFSRQHCDISQIPFQEINERLIQAHHLDPRFKSCLAFVKHNQRGCCLETWPSRGQSLSTLMKELSFDKTIHRFRRFQQLALTTALGALKTLEVLHRVCGLVHTNLSPKTIFLPSAQSPIVTLLGLHQTIQCGFTPSKDYYRTRTLTLPRDDELNRLDCNPFADIEALLYWIWSIYCQWSEFPWSKWSRHNYHFDGRRLAKEVCIRHGPLWIQQSMACLDRYKSERKDVNDVPPVSMYAEIRTFLKTSMTLETAEQATQQNNFGSPWKTLRDLSNAVKPSYSRRQPWQQTIQDQL